MATNIPGSRASAFSIRSRSRTGFGPIASEEDAVATIGVRFPPPGLACGVRARD